MDFSFDFYVLVYLGLKGTFYKLNLCPGSIAILTLFESKTDCLDQYANTLPMSTASTYSRIKLHIISAEYYDLLIPLLSISTEVPKITFPGWLDMDRLRDDI